PYRNLRKKISHEKNSIPKCRECTISFKLSNSGWFVDSNDFKEHNRDLRILREELQEQKTKIKQLNGIIADLNNSVTLRFARKIPFGKYIKRISSRTRR
ncbi:hypothetical protein, partial [[Eubacterium] cellulosolvens]